jgi:hypothetical protein
MKRSATKVLKWISLFLFFILTIPCKSINNDDIQIFDLKKIANNNSNSIFVSTNGEFRKPVLEISPKNNHTGVVIWKKGDKQDWSKGKYLVLEIFGDNAYSGVINIEFYKETGDSVGGKIILQSGELAGTDEEAPWVSSLMGILPRLKTKIVFPLSYLDAQNLFVPRSPRQLKGTVNGNRLEPNDITKVVLRFGPYFEPFFVPKFELASISICENIPEAYPPIDKPIIDKFGQWKLKNWDGKIKTEDELISKNLDLEKIAKSATLPDDWSKYGGWKEKQFKATGFFRTQHDGKRWWLVDPDGYAFLSTGVDGTRYGSSGPVNGLDDLFDWLPQNGNSRFEEVINNQRGGKNMDFYTANLIRVYGKTWKDKWSSVTAGLMRKYRFNTVGNWSDLNFAKKNGVSYVLPLNGFPSTQVLLYRDFPDVFSNEYKENSEKFARQLMDYKDDPYMVGYFLRNEPQWAFGYHNLGYEMFGTNQQSRTKDEFIKWIGEKYKGDVNEFNKAWKLDLKDFESLRTMTFKEYPSKIANDDFYVFSTIIVKKYVDIPCDEVVKIDKNHLNLGMRYAWLSSDLLYKAGERFDVFSINGYGINPPPTEEISKISGKPIMIGEFHHGAVDRGLPATGIIGVLSQEDRAKAYRNYIEQGFARPEIIGMHYFQWIDQPFYGRSDGENYNIGVVNMNNLPYPELTKAMTITNERIYKVASGSVAPFKTDLTKIPPIHY